MKVIDLRSDTFTMPTDEMRQAMHESEVGDDVYHEDPTINRLEELAAQVMGKEAALFTPSGIMSNLTAILTHTHRGDEIILGDEAHMLWHEMSGASTLGGVIMRTIPNDRDGRIEPDALAAVIRPKAGYFPQTTLLCLENTHNRCSGAVLTPEYTSEIAELAHQHGLKVHLDGARIFNAAVSLGVPATELAKPADSVCFCVSKGLSAPVGSLLCGNREFVEEARKWRRMLGGGMRQAGIIAAAGIIAIQKMVGRLSEDHANAQRLANGLAHIPGINLDPERIKTNIVIFEPPATTAPDFIQRMIAQNVKFSYTGGRIVRAVTHRLIMEAAIDEALNRVETMVKEQ